MKKLLQFILRRKLVKNGKSFCKGYDCGYETGRKDGYVAGKLSMSGLTIRVTTLEARVERQAKSIQKLFTKGAGRRLFTAKQE